MIDARADNGEKIMIKRYAKILIILTLILFFLPGLLNFLQNYDNDRGLLWLFLHQLYYGALGSWVGKPFFQQNSDIGFDVLLPGRFLTGFVYLFVLGALYSLYCFYKRRKRLSKR